MNTLGHLHQIVGGTLRAVGDTRDASEQLLGPISTDTRQLAPGEVFWALEGPNHSGADFAADAFARGAVGVVTTRPIEPAPGCWSLTVDAAQTALEQWAASKRHQFTGPVIGVTGSVGKTTTRQMIHTVLATELTGTASPKNYNNHIGVPLSMLRLQPDHDYAVLELGASRPREIAALCELCAPTVGVITQLGDAHLGGFGSRQRIAEAKIELLAALPADGWAVAVDDPCLRRVARDCQAPITWVGTRPECDLVADNVQWEHGELSFWIEDCEFRLPVWGRHHLAATLAAIAVGRRLGLPLERISHALKDFDPIPMRCEVQEVRQAVLINDTYNASPTAMKAALELLRDFDTAGRRIVVCGDMAELGDETKLLHRQLGKQVVTVAGADLLLACGQHAFEVVAGARAAGMPRPRAIPCRTLNDALPYLGQAILPGDVVLVKGSRVMAMERVVNALGQYPRRRSA